MAPRLKLVNGYGPKITDIIKNKNDAPDLFDPTRVKKFIKATKKVSKNKHGTVRPRNQKRFVQQDAEFSCNLRKMKCCAKSSNGSPCSRVVVRGLFLCWQHTLSIYKVRMDATTLPDPTNPGRTLKMNGLFACADIKKGQIIIPYFGEQLTQNQVEARYPGNNTAPYGVSVHGGGTKNIKVVDAACFQGMAGLANRGKSSGPAALKNNARLQNTSTSFPRLVATKRIKAGSEIFASYGQGNYQLTNSRLEPKEKIYKRSQTRCS